MVAPLRGRDGERGSQESPEGEAAPGWPPSPPRAAGCRRRPRPRRPGGWRRRRRRRRPGRTHQERALERQCQPLDQPPRPQLGSSGRRAGELLAQGVGPGVETAVGPAGRLDLGEQGLGGLRLPGDGAQHVQALDVARPFPDRVQGRLAVQARQAPLLDVAVAAQALQRLGGVHRRALARPVLQDRRGEPLERAAARRPPRPRRRSGPGASWPRSRPRTRPPGRRGRSSSAAARPAAGRRRAGGGVVDRLRRAPAHGGGRAGTQSRRVWLTISRIVGTPRPSAPTSPPRRRAARSRSTRSSGCRACPSAAEMEAVARAVRVKRGTRKQVSPPGAWARTKKASHMGAEQNHLWPVSSYSPLRPHPAGGGGVGPHVRAPLLLGHRHAAQRPGLLPRREQARVVLERGEERLPPGRQLGLGAQGGTPEKVMESGQPTPASTSASIRNSAARATCAPGPGSRQGRA